MRLRYVALAGLTVLMFTSFSPDVRADRIKDRQKQSGGKKTNVQAKFGFKGGGVGSGPVTVKGWPTYDTENSYSWGLYIESRRPRRIRLSAAFDIYNVKFSDIQDAQKNLINGSFELKFPMKRAEPKLAFQPGIGAGMGFLGSKLGSEKCYFFTLKFFGELLYYVTPKHGLTMELGFILAPTGTTAESRTHISAGPMIVYRAGLFL